MTSRLLPPSRRRWHWPTWFVSTKYRTVVTGDGGNEWNPVGEHHARRAGENLTACGQVAIGWPVFWLLPFQLQASTSCAACIDAVTATALKPHPRRPGCCGPGEPHRSGGVT